jgi:hypothetical protein
MNRDEEDKQEAFVNGLLFKIENEEISRDTMKIHTDYIDEGAQDEDFLYTKGPSDPEDWRQESRNFKEKEQRPDFSRFFVNEWRSAKMAAKHLKFCPGENCKKWLPLYNFAANWNMADKLDVYCITCNLNKRNERNTLFRPNKLKRKKKEEYIQVDKFELFNEAYNKNAPPLDLKTLKDIALKREMVKRIDDAAKFAINRYKKKFKYDSTEIERKLFQGGKYICNITGQILTRECFLEHHQLTFEYKKESKKIDVICSQCRKGNPPLWYGNFKMKGKNI